MATVDFTKPVTSDTRTAVLQYIRDAINSQARLFDGDTLISAPTGTVRWNSSSQDFESWSGSVWNKMPTGNDWLHSLRDFPNGTIVTTDIDYSVTYGDPWVLEVRGYPYTGGPPFDVQVGGYIYYDTMIAVGGLSNGSWISGMVVLNVAGKMTFWWPRQAYWQGFNVRVYVPYAGRNRNRVVSITDGVKPTGTKEVALNQYISQSLHGSNFTDYTLTRLNDQWQTSNDGRQRLFFSSNAATYIKGHDNILLRGSDNVDRFQFSSIAAGPYLYMTGSFPTVWFQDVDNRSFAIHVNANLAYFMRGGVNDTTWTTINDQYGAGRWMCLWDLNNGSMSMPGQLHVFNAIFGGDDIRAGTGQAGEKRLGMQNANRFTYFYTSTDGSETGLYDNTGGIFRWRSFSDGSFWIPNGFVALGGSGPIERLDVNGNIRLRGNRYVFFDTTGGVESNSIGVSNDYWLSLACGRGFAPAIHLRNEGWTQIVSDAGTLAMFVPANNLPASGGGYAYWAGGFSSPVSGRLFIGDNSGWRFHFSSRQSGATTDRFTFNDSGLFEASLAVQSANFRDSIGAFNVNLANNGSEGRGLVAGFSSSAYPGIGYNIRHVAAGGYIAPGGDTVSYVTFASGGFQFYGAASGTGGRTLSLSTLATLDLSGNLTATGNVTAYSDERLKKRFKRAYVSLDDLASVVPFEYTRRDTGDRQIGVKAQALQRVMPLAVQDGEFLSVDYGRAALVGVVSLAREVQKLKEKLDAIAN